MLVLARKENESIVIDGTVRVTILGIRGNQIRLGIEAPKDVPVVREELLGSEDEGLLPGPRLPLRIAP